MLFNRCLLVIYKFGIFLFVITNTEYVYRNMLYVLMVSEEKHECQFTKYDHSVNIYFNKC